MANDAAAEKPRSAKYRDNLPGRETNICCRRARYDRISAGLLDRDALTAAAMRLRSGFRYPAIRAYERLAGSRTNPRVHLWVIIDLSQPTNCKYAQKIDYLADGVGFEPTRSVNPCRFSRPVPSTARPPIHISDFTIVFTPIRETWRANATEIATERLNKRPLMPFYHFETPRRSWRRRPPASSL
jgi:hypothetical protein